MASAAGVAWAAVEPAEVSMPASAAFLVVAAHAPRGSAQPVAEAARLQQRGAPAFVQAARQAEAAAVAVEPAKEALPPAAPGRVAQLAAKVQAGWGHCAVHFRRPS